MPFRMSKPTEPQSKSNEGIRTRAEAGPTGFEPRGVRNLVSSDGLDSIVLS